MTYKESMISSTEEELPLWLLAEILLPDEKEQLDYPTKATHYETLVTKSRCVTTHKHHVVTIQLLNSNVGFGQQ